VDIVGKIYHSFGLAQPEPQAVSVQVRGASDPAQAAPRQGGTVEPSARDDTRKVLLHLIGKCDREVQCTRFDEFLRTRPTPLARPILTVGCCSDEDLPRQFIYKLREAIRIRLEKSGMPPAQYPTAFSLPPLDPERNDPVGWYTDHFLDEYGSAGGGPGAVPSAGLAPRNPKELVDRLTERPVPKFFYALAKTGSLDQALQRQRKLQEFLTAWPDLPKESPVFVVLLFTHAVRPSRMRGLLGGFFGKSTPTGFDSGNGDPFPAFANATVWGTPLPALARITGEELKWWIDSHGEPIARLVQDVNALERALFEELKRQRGLQMAELVRIMAKETGISVRF